MKNLLKTQQWLLQRDYIIISAPALSNALTATPRFPETETFTLFGSFDCFFRNPGITLNKNPIISLKIFCYSFQGSGCSPKSFPEMRSFDFCKTFFEESVDFQKNKTT